MVAKRGAVGIEPVPLSDDHVAGAFEKLDRVEREGDSDLTEDVVHSGDHRTDALRRRGRDAVGGDDVGEDVDEIGLDDARLELRVGAGIAVDGGREDDVAEAIADDPHHASRSPARRMGRVRRLCDPLDALVGKRLGPQTEPEGRLPVSDDAAGIDEIRRDALAGDRLVDDVDHPDAANESCGVGPDGAVLFFRNGDPVEPDFVGRAPAQARRLDQKRSRRVVAGGERARRSANDQVRRRGDEPRRNDGRRTAAGVRSKEPDPNRVTDADRLGRTGARAVLLRLRGTSGVMGTVGGRGVPHAARMAPEAPCGGASVNGDDSRDAGRIESFCQSGHARRPGVRFGREQREADESVPHARQAEQFRAVGV